MTRWHPATGIFLTSVIVVSVLVFLLLPDSGEPGPGDRREPLIVHVAAGIRPPMETIAAEFERATGQRVELRFAGSGNLLPSYELTKQGDLFLPADESYMRVVREKNLVAEVFSLAQMRAVVLLKAGETRVETFADLLRSEVKVAQANPDGAAIGKLTRERLHSRGLWSKLDRNTTVFKGTVTDVANAVKLGAVDAGVVWDAVAFQYPDLTTLKLVELDAVTANVQIAVLQSSANPAMARQFARYCASPDEGLVHFRRQGFSEVVEGESGLGNRPIQTDSLGIAFAHRSDAIPYDNSIDFIGCRAETPDGVRKGSAKNSLSQRPIEFARSRDCFGMDLGRERKE
jgi:molybdate transport system substrate-binding protein